MPTAFSPASGLVAVANESAMSVARLEQTLPKLLMVDRASGDVKFEKSQLRQATAETLGGESGRDFAERLEHASQGGLLIFRGKPAAAIPWVALRQLARARSGLPRVLQLALGSTDSSTRHIETDLGKMAFGSAGLQSFG